MIKIQCPFCGERDHHEFAYGGAAVAYPALNADVAQWHDAVYLRQNVRGVQKETWQHVTGCRQWLIVERDTVTHEVHSVVAAQFDTPPKPAVRS